MSEIIATVWDFDKTLIPSYMQDPIFDYFKYNSKDFWTTNNAEIKALEEGGVTVNHDTYYLNKFIRMSQKGRPFDGLNNVLLKELGAKLKYYEGAVELFETISQLNDKHRYKEFGIRFENYIVSTGFRRMIEGSTIAEFTKKIWGAELIDIEDPNDHQLRVSEIAYSLDNTSKTRALFEINKGVGIVEGSKIDVNTKIPHEQRRVQFCNMIYVADGPSDVPAFSVINQKNGCTLAVYPKGDKKAFRQADDLRKDGRVQMVAEADYREGSSAYLWIMTQLERQASAIIDSKLSPYRRDPGTPQHLL